MTKKQHAMIVSVLGILLSVIGAVYVEMTGAEQSPEVIVKSESPSSVPTNVEPAPSEQTDAYDVVRVVDGDTLIVRIDDEEARIRMIGVNTPESVDPRRPVECFGKEASAHLKSILEGKRVQLESDATQGDVDRYSRLLRYVFLDGQNVNERMIAEGYGHEYTYKKPYKYQAAFKDAQEEASAQKRGLWSDTSCTDVR